MLIVHPLEPVFDTSSRVLILGTMSSPKSREAGFYYAHPQNRFWKVLAALFKSEIPFGREIRREFVLRRHIALWDVLRSCEIEGASDASIKRPVPNDLSVVLDRAPIQAIFCTGTKSAAFYRKLIEPVTKHSAITLPSTSPANCAVSFERLCAAYGAILPWL